MGDALNFIREDMLDGLILALGRDGDITLPCAAFCVDVDESTQTATDARYVYASKEYCRVISRDLEGVIGRSYMEICEGDMAEWLAWCYRVVAQDETITGFWYDPLVRDWTCYTLAPSAMVGCCVYTFMRVTVDDAQRRQLMSTADARTSHIISEMLSELAAEQSYDAAMNGMLAMMSKVIHADRLSIFECSGSETKTTFELVAEGVRPQLGTVFGATREMLAYWFRNVTKNRVVLVPNTSVIERVSPPLYQWCRSTGVNSLLAAPFFNDGEIVGFLGAYNYSIDETVDLERLFEAVSTFIAARIENQQLIESLRRASSHDTLTDLLNRRGSELAIGNLLAKDPDGRHVLALMDIDDFKRVNDVFGHSVGDEALRAMTRTLRRSFPEDAILSRNGGDEFLVMLSGEAANNASALLANLTDRGLSFEHEGERHDLTISVGYARHPEQADSMRGLYAKADAALYAVKLAGKAGFGKYTPDADDHMRLRLGFSPRDLLENAPYCLLVSKADARGEILFASFALARMLGYTGMYDLMRGTGGTYAGIVDAGDGARVVGIIEQIDREGISSALPLVSLRAKTKDGGTTNVRVNFRFVEIEETGKVLYSYFVPDEERISAQLI